MKRIVGLLMFCTALLSCFASAEDLTSEQMEYIKGALYVPRDIVVTRYDCYEPDDSGEHGPGEGRIVVNLYSNDAILAGAVFDVNTLRPQYDVWDYSEIHVNPSAVEHQRANEWSEEDAAYLKGGFGIPWNVEAHCEVGEPYYWDGGGCWLTPVGFYAGENCIADTAMEEFLAGASIASDINRVSEVRDIFTYTPD